MTKTLKKLAFLVVLTVAVIGGILGTLSATANAQTSDEDALRAEVAANSSQFIKALTTGDKELIDSLWLQSDKTSRFNTSQPFRIEGWPDVRQTYAGILSLGASGSVTLNARQLRIDILGDDVAIITSHFVLNLRLPGGTRRTITGRSTAVLQKVDGEWLRVHFHTSVLP